jgi:hypothetical protein
MNGVSTNHNDTTVSTFMLVIIAVELQGGYRIAHENHTGHYAHVIVFRCSSVLDSMIPVPLWTGARGSVCAAARTPWEVAIPRVRDATGALPSTAPSASCSLWRIVDAKCQNGRRASCLRSSNNNQRLIIIITSGLPDSASSASRPPEPHHVANAVSEVLLLKTG